MARNPLFDSRDIRFVLFEFLEADGITRFPNYAGMDREDFENMLELAEKIAVEKMYPANIEADRSGVRFDRATGDVTAPPGIKAAFNAYRDAGFTGAADDPAIGGMGLPEIIAYSCNEMFTAGSLSFYTYPLLGHGNATLLKRFGSDTQKRVYLKNLVTGRWGGTMCLTEPGAGSDVGALTTKAVRHPDGTYRITGQKTFISNGDNDLYENIIHFVLARIEGDPPGTKGISIFIVPKMLPDDDGRPGTRNDVICTGVETKMGIRGSATCSLSFGDNGGCVGFLLGLERQGMRIMFHMINEARLAVARQGLAVASSAYMHAVSYANNRLQGGPIGDVSGGAGQVRIITHPDVKRMLLWMKSYVEGMRMLTYYLANHLDLEHILEGDARTEAKALVELLIPICKAGNTDTGVLIASEAMQVYGGYGFCADYPVEQFYRDAKIFALYEGTNGIQSMDLTMRKILMNPEQYNYNVWKKRVLDVMEKAKGTVEDKYTAIVEKGLAKLDETITLMKEQMAKGNFMSLFMNASQLRKAMFMLCLAWMHLWSLTIAIPKMKQLVGDAKGDEREKLLNENPEAAYYSGKVLSGQFFIGYEFPEYFGKLDSILMGESAVIKASPAIFTGAPEE